MLVPLQGASARCRCKVLVLECFLRFAAWLLVPLQGATARCCCQNAVCTLGLGCWRCCRVLLSECCCLRCGAWFLVPLLQGVAGGCCFQGAAVYAFQLGCWCCRVPLQDAAVSALCAFKLGRWRVRWKGAGAAALQGAAVRVLFALWSLVAGAAAVLLSECRCWCRCRGPGAAATRRCNTLLQGAAIRVAAGCCCESAVCALELGCRCPCCRVRVPLQGAGVGVLCALEKTFKCFPRTPFASSCYLGSMLAQF